MNLKNRDTTGVIIAAAIDVHRQLGPGLLESAYHSCLHHELRLRQVHVRSEVPVALEYKGLHVPNSYTMDLLVGDSVVVEVKAVRRLAPVHEAQLLTYLRLSGCRTGLLLNFHEPLLRRGIVRRVL